MILFFLNHLLVNFLCFTAGCLLYDFKINKARLENIPKHIIAYLITGLIGLTTLIQIIDLFFPVNIYLAFFILIIFSLIIFQKKEKFNFHFKLIANQIKILNPISIIGFISTWLLLLIISPGPTLMDDTESYHIQMIKWIQEFGTVPGIANLHERYGFNSSWFSSIAFFTFSTKYNFYTILNGTISIWLSFYLWTNVDLMFKNKQVPENLILSFSSLIMIVLGIFLWPLLRGNASTTNYDFITTFITIVLFFELLKSSKLNTPNSLSYELIIWPVYLFTVRIINYPLFLLTFFVLFILLRKKKHTIALTLISASIILTVPFILRNIYLSGYPFYPSPYFNIFNVDWKVEQKVLNELLRYIKYFNRINTMYQSIEETSSVGFPKWIFHWYKHLFYYDKIIVSLGTIGISTLPQILTNIIIKNKYLIVLFICLLFQLISWFIIAPDPRFIYGSFLIGASMIPIFISKYFNLYFLRIIIYFTTLILILFTLTLSIYKPLTDHRYFNLVMPYKLPQPPLKKVFINNIEFNIPEKTLNNWNSRCYASDLPCLYKVDSRLQPRGQTLKEGFYIKSFEKPIN